MGALLSGLTLAVLSHAIFQRWVTLICLVAFGLAQTVLSSLVVRCTDSSGQSRVEFGCAKSAQGTCAMQCCLSASGVEADDELAESAPLAPCNDEPIGPQLSTLKSSDGTVVPTPLMVAVLFAIECDPWTDLRDAPVARLVRRFERERPPDPLVRLRTVVLLV